jgi:endogenous inhibitor of DNA gyrase (YacG/DUF329 family)
MSDDNSDRRPTPKSGCPICGKAVVERYRPFCSARCADVDLNRWLSGRYAIPAEEPPDSDAMDGEEPSTDGSSKANRGS